MQRRSFLRLLGLAPIGAPALAIATSSEPPFKPEQYGRSFSISRDALIDETPAFYAEIERRIREGNSRLADSIREGLFSSLRKLLDDESARP